MTSDKTGNIAPSPAHIELEFSLGKRRAQLARLRPEELSEFLFGLLRQMNLRELRGFAPLRDVLSRGDDEPIKVANDCELYRASFFRNAQVDESFTLRTQSAKVCRGVCFQKLTYKRLESDEETGDYNVAKGWGNDAYVSAGTERVLVLIREANHSRADENLVSLDYRYAKVPHERRYLITSVTAVRILKENFCSFFEEKAPEIARDIIWELRSIHSRTLDQLVSQTDRMREEVSRWERISYSVE